MLVINHNSKCSIMPEFIFSIFMVMNWQRHNVGQVIKKFIIQLYYILYFGVFPVYYFPYFLLLLILSSVLKTLQILRAGKFCYCLEKKIVTIL